MDSFGLYKHKLIFVSCLLIVNTRSPSIIMHYSRGVLGRGNIQIEVQIHTGVFCSHIFDGIN